MPKKSVTVELENSYHRSSRKPKKGNKSKRSRHDETEYESFDDGGELSNTEYISERPSFDQLAAVHDEINHAKQMLTALAECKTDVAQRALDLQIAASELFDKVMAATVIDYPTGE